MIQEKYNPHEIEAKWQAYWEEHKTFKTEMDSSRPKSYVLEMFPYPSGNLHMGHVRNYSIGDVVARFRTMNGFNVLHPMVWDSFGASSFVFPKPARRRNSFTSLPCGQEA